jgi:hypothetical protein
MSADPKPGFLAYVTLLLTPFLLPCSAAVSGRLHQPNGQVRHGRMLTLTNSDAVLFHVASEGKPRVFRTDELKAFILNRTPPTNGPARPPNHIDLRDGTVISGQLLSIDESTLRVRPVYCDAVTIDRAEVTSVRWTAPASGISYEGLYTTNRWIISPLEDRENPVAKPGLAWKLEDGIFVSQGRGTLACEANMPTIARVEFDLHWRKKPQFRLAFFARDTEHYSYSEGYRFYSPGNGILFAVTRGNQPRQAVILSKAPVPAFVGSNYVHLDFRLNSQTGEGWLFADGKKIRHWTDLGYSGAGTAVMFYNFNAQNRLGVANLRVAKWDGRTAHDPPPSQRRHTIVFRNGDTVETEKLTLTGTNLTFRFHDRPLTIPADRAAQIFMPLSRSARPAHSPWIQFLHGDWIRAAIVAITDDAVTWRHHSANTAHTTPLSQIRGLHFATEKPVMDLSWYLPTMPASERNP